MFTSDVQTGIIIGKIKVRGVFVRKTKIALVGICISPLSVLGIVMFSTSAHNSAVLIKFGQNFAELCSEWMNRVNYYIKSGLVPAAK